MDNKTFIKDEPPVSPNKFQTIPYLARRFAQEKKQLAFTATSLAEWKIWHARLRAKLKQLTGYNDLLPAPLKARVTETVDCGDYLRQRVEIQTEPGLFMPLFVLVPHRRKPPYPPVIAAHGHCSAGKLAVVGLPFNEEHHRLIKVHNYAYGVEFVRQGCIVFCPDARGFGERREKGPVNLLGQSCGILNPASYPLGLSLAGMWAWDLHRLIDYIQTRKDSCVGKLACVGLSGGGLQTLYATALDDRISCAVVSGYFYGVKQSLMDIVCCECNYVPDLWRYADMGDLGALIAPRPFCIETGDQDGLNGASGLKNVRRQMAIVRRAYALLNVSENLKHDIFKGKHQWNGVKSIPLVMKHFKSN